MAKYRKKPVVIEAFEYDGELLSRDSGYYVPEWAYQALLKGVLFYASRWEKQVTGETFRFQRNWDLFIETLEGDMLVNVGDYVIRGVQGEIYPCKPGIFKATYDFVEEDVYNE